MRVNRSFLAGAILGAIAAGAAGYFLRKSCSSPTAGTERFGSYEWAPREQVIPDSFHAAWQAGLLGNLLDLIDADLHDDPQRKLASETIDRIAAFCYGARPYLAIEGDSLGRGPFSPERGQLLLVLARMNLDTATWQVIKDKASFAAAYIPEADLSQADLRGIDLRHACLRDARLDGAKLAGADLSGAMLRGAGLYRAGLERTRLNRANLCWSNLTEARLPGADLGGAQLVSAQLDRSTLQGAAFSWADARHATIRSANLTGADLSGTNLHMALLDSTRLDSAVLSHTKMMDVSLHHASLRHAELNLMAVPNRTWFDDLHRWQVDGAEDLRNAYDFVDERPKGRQQFILKKKTN